MRVARGTPHIAAITLAGLIAGCDSPAVSVRPLYTSIDNQNLVKEPKIEGDWLVPLMDKAGTEDEAWLRVHVEPRQDGRYSLEVRPANPDPGEEDQVTRYDLALVTFDGTLFFDAAFNEAQGGQRTVKPDSYFGLVPIHILGTLRAQDDFLRATMPLSSWVEKNTPAAFREYLELSDNDIAVITASTADLRAFMAKYADQDESSFVIYLCRPDVDCAARGFEDAIVHAPDDSELLKEAANFYLKRGDYDRAVELKRRRVQREPNVATHRSELGQALMFRRDFDGARKEFMAAQQLDPLLASAKDGIIWTHFLEGQFAEAALASNPAALNERPSVDSILLHYFSLERLRRQSEASAFLSEQVATFTGFREEHVLLLEVQGRVRESKWRFPEGEPARRGLYYSALRALTNGNTRIARNRLENLFAGIAIKKPPNDSLIGLAARIELDRLMPNPPSNPR